jgi:hypothetical protein
MEVLKQLTRSDTMSQKQCKKSYIDNVKSEIILNEYETCVSLKILSEKVSMSLSAVKKWANNHGLKRTINIKRNGNMSKLLDGSIESFMWLGFIAADGHIDKRGSLVIYQTIKDIDLIENLSKYLSVKYKKVNSKIGFSANTDFFQISLGHKDIGLSIRKMWNITNLPKTKTGINLDFISSEKDAISFLIGFICGDGSLSKHGYYRITCHSGWFETFKILMSKCKCLNNDYVLRITNNGYCEFRLRMKASKFLRNFAHENNLPCSSRKFPTH